MKVVAILVLCMAGLLAVSGRGAQQPAAPEEAPFINVWLVAGTFDNDAQNGGFARDLIGEADAQPALNAAAGGKPWRYFDDRLFSRNYDNYQDLFSYFRIKRGESVAAKIAYAHVYVYSPAEQAAQLRIGADNLCKAWLNGRLTLESEKSGPYRDTLKTDVTLNAGWNRLLLKIANQEDGRFGFYARLCRADGGPLSGLIFSPGGSAGSLSISTQAMEEIQTGALPVAFREWRYVGADPLRDPDPYTGAFLSRKPHLRMLAADFQLTAQGGAPPYRWSLAGGSLPPGLKLNADGAITGEVSAQARLGDYPFEARVTDSAGRSAVKPLRLTVRDRPNRWYEEARLVALIHNPESILNAEEGELQRFAQTMKRQGYALGMMISYNNGDVKYRWNSLYEPDNPLGDLAGRYKSALEAEGVRFGMYMGNLIGPNHGGENGAILMVEEAMRRYKPAALWFDWASPDPDGYASLDALYSMIRTHSPETLIVLNGVGTLYQGDWDVICMEGWGAWGERIWSVWPFPIAWSKRAPVESWRLIADPAFEYTRNIQPDWQEYLRVQISLIGQGFVANMDHSPTITTPYRRLEESVVMQAHLRMAEWANPPGAPPLHESYTNVHPGPLPPADWGYNTLSLSRTALYLHLMRDPFGKTGFPETSSLTVGPVRRKVKSVLWLNRGVPARFSQRGERLTISLEGVTADPIDTIFKIELESPYPPYAPPPVRKTEPAPPGNLAFGKLAQLLSADGERQLVASAFAFALYGVDGLMQTHAQGAYEWAWAYQVDLQRRRAVSRVVIHFVPGGYATEYRLLLSEDGKKWVTAAHVKNCRGGTQRHILTPPLPARYVRVQAVKPDGPGQEGGQMGIAELEVYE